MNTEWKIRFIYPQHLRHHPLLYRLIRQFDLEANILEAQTTETGGYVIAVLSGGEDQLRAGLDWMADQGIHVDILTEASTPEL